MLVCRLTTISSSSCSWCLARLSYETTTITVKTTMMMTSATTTTMLTRSHESWCLLSPLLDKWVTWLAGSLTGCLAMLSKCVNFLLLLLLLAYFRVPVHTFGGILNWYLRVRVCLGEHVYSLVLLFLVPSTDDVILTQARNVIIIVLLSLFWVLCSALLLCLSLSVHVCDIFVCLVVVQSFCFRWFSMAIESARAKLWNQSVNRRWALHSL